jgi:hypothetical protein
MNIATGTAIASVWLCVAAIAFSPEPVNLLTETALLIGFLTSVCIALTTVGSGDKEVKKSCPLTKTDHP